jgi:hypothetical protein
VNRSLNRCFDPIELRQLVRKSYTPQDSIAWDKLRTSQPGEKQEILLGLKVAHPEALRLLADLFALLSLEKPPGNPDNQAISGTPEKLHRR